MEQLTHFQRIQWDAVEAITAIITTLFAGLVYLEARSIRRVQWVSHAASQWQDFNRFLIESNKADRWNSIISGQLEGGPLGTIDKRLFWMYFNIQSVEYYLIHHGITSPHPLQAMKEELRGLLPHKEFAINTLKAGGYDPKYREFVISCLS